MKYITILLLGGILVSCSSLDPIHLRSDLQKAMLTGKVITEEGLPLEGVTVRLNEFQETMTDINGRFLFNYIRHGKHTVVTEKDEYLPGEYKFIYNFRNRKLKFAKIKMLSLNHLVDEGFEFLKENKFDKAQAIIEQLDEFNYDEEIVLYLKSMYLYLNEKYDDAIVILENLKGRDRKNVYYQLTLIDIYERLKMYQEMADLCLYLGKNKPRDYAEYIILGKKIYKEKLGQIIDDGEIDKILIEQVRKDKIKKEQKIEVKIKKEEIIAPEEKPAIKEVVEEVKEEKVEEVTEEIKEESIEEEIKKDIIEDVKKDDKEEAEKKQTENKVIEVEKIEKVDKVEKVKTKEKEDPKKEEKKTVEKKKIKPKDQKSYYQMYIEEKRKSSSRNRR